MRTTATIARVSTLGIMGVLPALAMAAEDVDYSYFQVNAIGQDVDAFDEEEDAIEDLDDGGGFGVHGSFAFLPRFFVFGSYSDTESDVAFASAEVFPVPADTDIKRFDVGIGTNHELSDRVDFVARLAYTDIDYGDFDIGGDDDLIPDGGLDEIRDELRGDDSDGYFVDAGVRSQLTENLEGAIGLRYTDVQNIDTTTVIGSLMFELSDSWGIELGVDAGDELSIYQLGFRFAPEI